MIGLRATFKNIISSWAANSTVVKQHAFANFDESTTEINWHTTLIDTVAYIYIETSMCCVRILICDLQQYNWQFKPARWVGSSCKYELITNVQWHCSRLENGRYLRTCQLLLRSLRRGSVKSYITLFEKCIDWLFFFLPLSEVWCHCWRSKYRETHRSPSSCLPQ